MFYAAVDTDDVGHERAASVIAGSEPLVCTEHVLVETMLLLQRRSGWTIAERFWRGIADGIARIEQTGQADLDVARAIGEEFSDQTFSIVDRTSFAVMNRLGITRVASFDADFAIYRFGPNRRRAFEVVV